MTTIHAFDIPDNGGTLTCGLSRIIGQRSKLQIHIHTNISHDVGNQQLCRGLCSLGFSTHDHHQR